MLILGMLMAIVLTYICIDRSRSAKTSARLPKEIIGRDGAPMVLIPAGEFLMGTDDAGSRGRPSHKPAQTVHVGAFYMDKYEVTNAQYRHFVRETGHREPMGFGFADGKFDEEFKPWLHENYSKDEQPVVCVTCEDANAYAEWAGKRLPTEEEWEKAARGGLVGKRYSWGDDWPPPDGTGNFGDESGTRVYPRWIAIPNYNDGHVYNSPRGSFRPNGYGLYDMAGNARELCMGTWKNQPSTRFCIVRGGGRHTSEAEGLRVTFRMPCAVNATAFHLGFRCALSVPNDVPPRS